MSVNVKLRDETAGSDLISEDLDNPVIAYPAGGWEADLNQQIIAKRLNELRLQAEMFVGPGATGHTYSIKKAGVVVGTIAPLAAFTQHVLRRYISGALQDPENPEVFPAGEGNRGPYGQRRTQLLTNQELNPTNTFTDLPT